MTQEAMYRHRLIPLLPFESVYMKKGIEITLKIVNVFAVLNMDVDGANDGKNFPSDNSNADCESISNEDDNNVDVDVDDDDDDALL